MWWVRAKLLSHVWLFATLWTVCPWDSSGKNTGVGCHALLHEIFLTQGLNPCLLHFLHWQAGYRQVPKNDWAGAYVKPAFLSYGLKVKKKSVILLHFSVLFILSSLVLRASSDFSKRRKEVANILLISLYHLKEAELGPENELAFLIFSFSIHFSRVPLVCWKTAYLKIESLTKPCSFLVFLWKWASSSCLNGASDF